MHNKSLDSIRQWLKITPPPRRGYSPPPISFQEIRHPIKNIPARKFPNKNVHEEVKIRMIGGANRAPLKIQEACPARGLKASVGNTRGRLKTEVGANRYIDTGHFSLPL